MAKLKQTKTTRITHKLGKSSKSRKTITRVTKSIARNKQDNILHHHLLIRCELGTRLYKTDSTRIQKFLDNITQDIHMKKLGALTFWVDGDKIKEGITGVNVIETSHIAAHVWNHPEPRILHHTKSRALMQFDIYTCGRLTNEDIIIALEHLKQFQPTHITMTLLNRKWSLTIDRHISWTLGESQTWLEWIDKQKITK